MYVYTFIHWCSQSLWPGPRPPLITSLQNNSSWPIISCLNCEPVRTVSISWGGHTYVRGIIHGTRIEEDYGSGAEARKTNVKNSRLPSAIKNVAFSNWVLNHAHMSYKHSPPLNLRHVVLDKGMTTLQRNLKVQSKIKKVVSV